MSITETLTPLAARFSATSRPMKPAPQTTARFTAPVSSSSRSAIASSGFLMTKTFLSSAPGSFGTTGDAPTAITSLSYS